MTRFARAVGSKASNKREEEEATPWSVMVAGVKRPDVGVEDDVDYQQEGIEDEEDTDVRMLEESEEEDDEEEGVAMQVEDDLEEASADFGGDLKRKLPVELISQDEPSKKKKKRKKSEKCLVCGEKGHRKMDCTRLPEERRKELQDLYNMKVERKGKGTGRKKKKQDKAGDENRNESSALLPFETEEIKVKDVEKETTERGHIVDTMRSDKKKKKGNPKRDRSGALIEDGEALFQGFRVTREDKERLEKLEKKLKQGGVGGEELEITLKRERRMAEKSLARSKKMVCFNCRQPGHMLADCPGAIEKGGQVEAPNAGQCYKCGSLEHTSRDCTSKLKRENAYRFAVCFICKEEGHLAKACPDNPKGLYPKGGGCVFCGSVEHLKRDCPRKVEKDIAQGMRVGTIGNDLEEEPMTQVGKFKKIKEKKAARVVAF